MLILLFKNVLKLSNFVKSAKTSKNLKKTAKKTSIFFCVYAFTREEKNSIIKIACFMLDFLNLKSKARHLFFWVASSLSILCTYLLFTTNWKNLSPTSYIPQESIGQLSDFLPSATWVGRRLELSRTWQVSGWSVSWGWQRGRCLLYGCLCYGRQRWR